MPSGGHPVVPKAFRICYSCHLRNFKPFLVLEFHTMFTISKFSVTVVSRIKNNHAEVGGMGAIILILPEVTELVSGSVEVELRAY